MSAKSLTSSFDSNRRKKKEESGRKKESLWATELIPLTLQSDLDWFSSHVSLWMRALGIFAKVTPLSLVVLEVQVQGNNRYSWSPGPGYTDAIGLKGGWPFLLSFPRSMDRYITLSLEPSLPHLDPEMWFLWLRHVCVVRKCYVVSDKGSRKQIWVKWSVYKNDGQGQVWHILSERTASILDFSGHTVSASLLQHCST